MNMQILAGILLPFFGTSLGVAMVFFLKDSISNNLQRILTGFAAGVMVAASFWSLLQPALEGSAHMGRLSFLPAPLPAGVCGGGHVLCGRGRADPGDVGRKTF